MLFADTTDYAGRTYAGFFVRRDWQLNRKPAPWILWGVAQNISARVIKPCIYLARISDKGRIQTVGWRTRREARAALKDYLDAQALA